MVQHNSKSEPGAEVCTSPNIDPKTFHFKALVSSYKESRCGSSNCVFQTIEFSNYFFVSLAQLCRISEQARRFLFVEKSYSKVLYIWLWRLDPSNVNHGSTGFPLSFPNATHNIISFVIIIITSSGSSSVLRLSDVFLNFSVFQSSWLLIYWTQQKAVWDWTSIAMRKCLACPRKICSDGVESVVLGLWALQSSTLAFLEVPVKGHYPRFGWIEHSQKMMPFL